MSGTHALPTPIQGTPERLQIASAGTAITLASLGLIGWCLHLTVLISIARGLPQMKANTAIALLLSGTAVLCLRTGAGPQARRAGRLLGAVVCLFGLAVCFEYLIRPLGFDQLLFRDPGSKFPGRPSPNASIALIALGAALAALDARHVPEWVKQALLVASSAIVLFAVTGYAYHVPLLRGFGGRTGMSPQTLVALAMLMLGAFSLRPDRGLTPLVRGSDPGARVARILIPAGILASIGSGWITLGLQRNGLLGADAAQATLALLRAFVISAVVVVLAARIRRSDLRDHQLAALVRASPDAILRARDGVITELNPATEKLFGYSAQELLGRPPTILAPPDLLEEARMLRARAEAGETLRVQTQRMRKDGVVFDVALTVSAVRDSDGRHSGVMIVARDITEELRIEQALRELNASLHAIFDNAPIGLSLRDLDGNHVKVNDYLAATLGLTPAELESRSVAEVLAPAQVARMRGEIEEIIRTRLPVTSESEHLAPDGERRAFEVVRYPVLDERSEVASIGTFVLDVTERKEALAGLEAAERRFRSAFDSAPIGMVIFGLDGGLLEVNAAFCGILGRERDDLVGRQLETLVHPEDVELGRGPIHALASNGRGSYSDESRFVHSSGRTVHAQAQATLLRGPDGQPLHYLGQFQDITERKRHEAQLEFLADHDALTGLVNRRAFKRELEAHARLIERDGAVGAVLVIDLDQFKFVNDTLGHQAGDELISRAAAMFSGRVRSADVIARLGGDEFGILLRRAGRAEARLVADSLLAALRDEAISIGGLDRRISASIGIAMFADGTSPDGEDVLVNADLAMYDAKEAGRDGVALFSCSEHNESRMKGQITWAHRIQSALAQDRFTLLAQPIVDLRTGRVSQYELLLRMLDERGNLIAPNDFLPIAERVDLMLQVDTWVISHGIRMLSELDLATPDAAIEINLSGSSLGNQQLLAHIEHELDVTGVDPARIIFEVTETAALGSISEARAFGQRLSELGCRFALDDFGAGFGSFYYLKHLHFDLIKIDGEFVRNCRTSDTDQLLIRAIVGIAQGLGKHTVAEFVGDAETVELLSELGVDYGQGYHLGVPAPLRTQLGTTAPPRLRVARAIAHVAR